MKQTRGLFYYFFTIIFWALYAAPKFYVHRQTDIQTDIVRF